MTEQFSPEDIQKWHRYFAVECNNGAWQLSLDAERDARLYELLNLAHAAAYHWSKVGTELNHMRAKLLCAHIHAFCGMGATALDYANECFNFFTQRDTDGWELAFTYMIRAQAAHAAGNSALHASAYEATQTMIDALESEEDKEIVMLTWVNIPQPM